MIHAGPSAQLFGRLGTSKTDEKQAAQQQQASDNYSHYSYPKMVDLQNALKALSAATGNASIDPGTVDGILGTHTRTALSQAMSYIAPKLPRAIGLPLSIAATASVFSPDTFDRLIIAQMVTITDVILVAASQAGSGALPTDSGGNTDVGPSFSSPPWYKTWWGIGGIAMGSLGVILVASSLTSRHHEAT